MRSDGSNLQEYSFSTIKVATDNFSNDNKLGKGGFGPVYKVTKNDLYLLQEISKCLSTYCSIISPYKKHAWSLNLPSQTPRLTLPELFSRI